MFKKVILLNFIKLLDYTTCSDKFFGVSNFYQLLIVYRRRDEEILQWLELCDLSPKHVGNPCYFVKHQLKKLCNKGYVFLFFQSVVDSSAQSEPPWKVQGFIIFIFIFPSPIII